MANQDLNKLRQNIDLIDNEILDLLNQRANIAIAVGKAKEGSDKTFYVPSREKAIYARLTQNNCGPFPNDAVCKVFREIISASLNMEMPMKVAFLGPQSTFTHMAAMLQFGLSAQLIPMKSIPAVFEEVERGRAHYGVVPVENSTEGVVNHTLDMFFNSELQMIAEVMLEISHNLLSKTGDPEKIRKIVSHPQSLAQCRHWLETNMADIPQMDVASTAAAAQLATGDESVAAIASHAAAVQYDLQVVKAKIEDNPNNFTRFLVIGKKTPEKSGADKTSIMFSVKDEPGILYRMLEPFSQRQINLAKIESRPMKEKAWEYIFFLDLIGHAEDPEIAEAIEELRSHCHFLKILGSYPIAGNESSIGEQR
ncbi:chorismate mutase [Desulfuromusa kysingii]|uniref:Bifunctional chorismate mutase/prephenate dehydratase n=1 Tax=Desulfuromusa kysingii TaxID=37625 RepID=A0A1H3YCQ4_9BACT|nr:prephenate dehydratase [Desulfuromusa kysingii]SEA09339.1 chorismate mutase [Desulfuromusa kysingii]